MKTIVRAMLGMVCIVLTGVTTAYGVNYWDFESGNLTGLGWNPASATITAADFHSGAQAVSITAGGSVSKSAGPGTKVITDFWTVPNPVTVNPAVATDASVQFVFKSGSPGKVAVVDGADYGSDITLTGVPVDGSTWIHVTVIQEYTTGGAGTWSLKINDSPVAAGALHDIDQATYDSFSIANGSGTVLLDDVSIVSDLDEPVSGYSLADAGATVASGDASGNDVTISTATSLGDSVKVYSNYLCRTTEDWVATLPLTQNGSVKTATSSSEPLATHDNLYFKLVAGATTESTPSFAVHQQARSGAVGANYWVGINIDYGAQSTVAGTLGDHLKRGLTPGEAAGSSPNLIVRDPAHVNPTIYWLGSGGWTYLSGPGSDADTIPVGSAVLIQTKNTEAIAASKAVFAGPQIDNTPASYSATMAEGWNMLSRPFEGSKAIDAALPSSSTGDMMYLYRGGVYKLLKKSASGWKTYAGGDLPTGFASLQFDEGAFYYSVGGAGTFNLAK